jgi:hypothetical protein
MSLDFVKTPHNSNAREVFPPHGLFTQARNFLGIGLSPNIIHNSVLNDDAIQARPCSLPTPTLLGALGLWLNISGGANCR